MSNLLLGWFHTGGRAQIWAHLTPKSGSFDKCKPGSTWKGGLGHNPCVLGHGTDEMWKQLWPNKEVGCYISNNYCLHDGCCFFFFVCIGDWKPTTCIPPPTVLDGIHTQVCLGTERFVPSVKTPLVTISTGTTGYQHYSPYSNNCLQLL